MADRGSYRSIHTVIIDGPDFQALKPGAKLVWYTLKLTLGASGIDVVPSLVGTLMERTGAELKHVEKGLAQLVAEGWVQVERNVVWMVDGLKHDPHISLDNQNHRIQIARHLNGLPRLAIVDAFRAYYGFATPPVEMPSSPSENGLGDASKMASTIPSKMASKKPSVSREKGKGEGKGRRETDKGDRVSAAGASGTGRSTRAGKTTWLTPFADAWREKYGGEMGAGKAVKALTRLIDVHGADEVLRRWVIYIGATAAEYANASKFSETWGRWAAAIVRTVPAGSSPAPALSARDEARAEAGVLVARLRDLVYDQMIPGQGFKRLLRIADVEAMGADVAAAVKNTGGVAKLLKLDADPSEISYYIGDFAAALAVARRPADPGAREVQSA